MKPFEDSLGLEVTEKHEDGVTIEVPIRPDLLNGQGVMHGGVIASIADEAAWQALEHHYGRGKYQSTTTELKVNYLRPLSGEKVIARAVVVRAGKTLCVSRVDLFDTEGRLGGLAVVTYMLLGEKTRG
ncbi:MAG: PaaI family thioesterase [Bryobacteraceae bacterium]|nr:PaaI family thioesterase [Bryobacteraceae bacterium]